MSFNSHLLAVALAQSFSAKGEIMEIAKVEVVAVEQAEQIAKIEAVQELNGLQLALVGGGIGSVEFG